jgi:hypothetical protein
MVAPAGDLFLSPSGETPPAGRWPALLFLHARHHIKKAGMGLEPSRQVSGSYLF